MLYTIIETVRYEIEADSPGEAEEILLQNTWLDDNFFVSVEERHVIAKEPPAKPAFSRGDYIQKHAEA